MRARCVAIAFALLVACGELRKADDRTPSLAPTSNDAGSSGDDEHDGGGVPIDGGPKAKDDASVVPPVLCTDCPVETVFEQLGTFGPIVLDDANVYVSELGSDTLRCAKAGCDAPTTLFAKGPTALALADGKLWFPDHQSLSSCATAGCAGVSTHVLTEPTLIGDVASDGTRVVWKIPGTNADVLRSCPAANCATGTAVTVKDDSYSRILTAGGGLLVWINSVSEVLACKNDELCTSPKHLGSLARTDVAVNADAAFWVTESSEIAKCALSGCGDRPTIIAKANSPRATAADATHVYWRSSTDDTIERCPVSDCTTPETIATGITTASFQNLALDDRYVYCATRDGVYRRRK